MFQRRPRLAAGAVAPDVDVLTLEGAPVKLLGLRGPRLTAFVFARHFG